MAARVRRVVAVLSAVVAASLVMWVLGAGAGPLPALGPALAPVRGVWASAAGAELPHSQALKAPGLTGAARIAFTSSGVASVRAGNDHDLFLAQGYLAARFRLSQMDLERRFGEGRLAQLNGTSMVSSDEFELRLGLLRTARAEWAATPAGSPAAEALTAYAAGVNDRLAELRGSHEWPALYGLTGVHPGRWTPVDSLVVQEVLTQQLDFSTGPLDQSILNDALGSARTADWYPVQPANAQHPYDPGPYRNLGIAPITGANADAAHPAVMAGEAVPTSAPAATAGTATADRTATTSTGRAAQAAAAILTGLGALPSGAEHVHSDSNAWAVNGPAAQGGVALLAGDPHLQLSLPSDWYEISLRSPDLDVTGASLPGAPAVLIGHNRHISWSLTDVQNQSTLFYKERTSAAHPGQYYWHGAWHRFQQVHYRIPVRGSATVGFTAELAPQGPVLTEKGQTTAVDWMGDVPSPDVDALIKVNAASDWTDFTAALREWHAPTQNFVYADDQGNIGIIAPGYYPLVRSGKPWLTLSGTGAQDVAGTIPFAAVPRSYDPPGHVLATANQRPVTADYPYYIGTSLGFDPGYRADEIYRVLGAGGNTESDMAGLQTSVTDRLAQEMVPRLLTALRSAPLDARGRAARKLLVGWNDSMNASSAAATVWWTFWTEYLTGVFQPWWTQAKVPVHLDQWNLTLANLPGPLEQDLEQWTLHDPSNAAFTPPGAADGDAATAMRSAFTATVRSLTGKLGGDPARWTWGRVHDRSVPSVTQVPSLGYGPYPAGGDKRTVNAADDGMDSDFGPSWRMIVDWTGTGRAEAEAVYPGGQSENPSSPWYENLVPDWWNGRYLPLYAASEQPSGGALWTLRPGR